MELAGGQEQRIAEIQKCYGIARDVLIGLAGQVMPPNTGVFRDCIDSGVVDLESADRLYIERTATYIRRFLTVNLPQRVSSFLVKLVETDELGIQVNGSLARTGGMSEEEFSSYLANGVDLDLNLYYRGGESMTAVELLDLIQRLAREHFSDIDDQIYYLYPSGQAFGQHTDGDPFVWASSIDGAKFSFALTPTIDEYGEVHVEPSLERQIDEPSQANFRAPDTFTNAFRLTATPDGELEVDENISRNAFLRTLLYTISGDVLQLVAFPISSLDLEQVKHDPWLIEYLLVQREKMRGRAIFSDEISTLLREGSQSATGLLEYDGQLYFIDDPITRMILFDHGYVQEKDWSRLLTTASLVRHWGWYGEEFNQEIEEQLGRFLADFAGSELKLGGNMIEIPNKAQKLPVEKQIELMHELAERLGLRPELQEMVASASVRPLQNERMFILLRQKSPYSAFDFAVDVLKIGKNMIIPAAILALILEFTDVDHAADRAMLAATILYNLGLICFFANEKRKQIKYNHVFLGKDAIEASRRYEGN